MIRMTLLSERIGIRPEVVATLILRHLDRSPNTVLSSPHSMTLEDSSLG